MFYLNKLFGFRQFALACLHTRQGQVETKPMAPKLDQVLSSHDRGVKFGGKGLGRQFEFQTFNSGVPTAGGSGGIPFPVFRKKPNHFSLLLLYPYFLCPCPP